MPKSFFFKPEVDTQSLPFELQQSILMYLPVEDVANMANTSRTLKQVVTISEPPPKMEFHQDLQLFKERRAIVAGYRTLQQSTLPAWLKARWSTKKNMLIAISQAVIAIDVDSAIPLFRRVKPIDDVLVLTEAWSKWIIEIHRNDQGLVAEPISALDTLSLQALCANYHVQLLCNSTEGLLHDDQALVLALLEISEIFLSCADPQIALAGLQALYHDFMGDKQLINVFTEKDNVFHTRNRLLSNGVASDSQANDSSDGEEQASSELVDRDNDELLVRLNFYLSAPVLLAIAEGYFTVYAMVDFSNDAVVAALVTPNGLVAMKEGFLSFRQVQMESLSLTDEQLLTVVQFLLSDACLAAVAKGLINPSQKIFEALGNYLFDYYGMIDVPNMLRLNSDTLLTPHGESVAKALGLELAARLPLDNWQSQLALMNKPLVKEQLTQASAPTLSR